MPFIFLFQRVSSLALFIFITEELGGCALRNAMQNFSKEFSSAPPSPPRKWLLSRLFTRQPFLTFLYLPFSFFFFLLFFFTTCYVFPRSYFPRFFPYPDFHEFFFTSRGQRLFFLLPPRRWKELKRDTLMPRAGLHSLNDDFAKSVERCARRKEKISANVSILYITCLRVIKFGKMWILN